MKLRIVYEIDTEERMFHHDQNLVEFICDGFSKKDVKDPETYRNLFNSVIEIVPSYTEPAIENYKEHFMEVYNHLDKKED